MKATLTPKEESFCREYVANNGNATKAAEAAGYSKKTARQIGTEILTKPSIKARLKALSAKSVAKSEATAERVVEELAILALSDIADFVECEEGEAVKIKSFSSLPKGATRAIKKIKAKQNFTPEGAISDSVVELEFWSKTDALDMLARKHGLFDGVDVTDNRTFNFTFVKATKKAG
jgi:phage terminase small subunit